MKISFIEPNGECATCKVNDPTLKKRWKELLDESDNLESVFQSPMWFEMLCKSYDRKNLFVGVLSDSNSKIMAITPLSRAKYNLKFDIHARTLFNVEFKSVHILGSELQFPQDENLYDEFFSSILDKFKDSECFVFESVHSGNYLWEYMNKSKFLKNNFIKCMPDQVRKFHYLDLPDTFDEYLSSHSRHFRQEYKRKLKKLTTNFEPVEIKIFEKPEEVDKFIEYTDEIEKESWKYDVFGQRMRCNERYIFLAKKGLFHGCVLFCASEPVAFIQGYIYLNLYAGIEMSFKHSFKDYAPGIVLLFSLLQNLIEKPGLNRLCLGYGHSYLKEKICNNHTEDATIVLLKNTLKNKTYNTTHSMFNYVKEYTKKFKN